MPTTKTTKKHKKLRVGSFATVVDASYHKNFADGDLVKIADRRRAYTGKPGGPHTEYLLAPWDHPGFHPHDNWVYEDQIVAARRPADAAPRRR